MQREIEVRDKDKEPIITVMKVVMQAAGINQTEMAYKCKTHQPMISRYASGLEVPHLAMQKTIAQVLSWDLDLDTLFQPYNGPEQLLPPTV